MGKYVNTLANDALEDCISCPIGQWTNTSGSTSSTDCIDMKCTGNTISSNNVECSSFVDDTSTGIYLPRSGICLETDNSIKMDTDGSEIVSDTDCISPATWHDYSNIKYDNGITTDKKDKCCLLLPTDQSCQFIWESSSTCSGVYDKKSSITDANTVSIEGGDPVNICCEERSGFCIDNVDGATDASCSQTQDITTDRTLENGGAGNCCQDRSGFCIHNADSSTDAVCTATQNITTDRTLVNDGTGNCCIDKATCANKDGTGTSITNADCGTGFIVRSGLSDKYCEGSICDMSIPGDKNTCCVALATCGDADGSGTGTVAVDCGTGFIIKSGVSSTPCSGDTCDMSNPTDKGICCDTKATCGATPTCPTGYIPKDGSSDTHCIGTTCIMSSHLDRDTCCSALGTCGATPNCPTGYIPKPRTTNVQCSGVTCDMGIISDRDKCCIPHATCGDKDGSGSGTNPVSDTDCGEGFIYNTASSSLPCVGTTCDMTNTADKTACCTTQATCGDKDGSGTGTNPVSDADCGEGFIYNTLSGSLNCTGGSCDMSVPADKTTCCKLSGCKTYFTSDTSITCPAGKEKNINQDCGSDSSLPSCSNSTCCIDFLKCKDYDCSSRSWVPTSPVAPTSSINQGEKIISMEKNSDNSWKITLSNNHTIRKSTKANIMIIDKHGSVCGVNPKNRPIRIRDVDESTNSITTLDITNGGDVGNCAIAPVTMKNIPEKDEDNQTRDPINICCTEITDQCFQNTNGLNDIDCPPPTTNMDWSCNCKEGITMSECTTSECWKKKNRGNCTGNCVINEVPLKSQGGITGKGTDTCCGISGRCVGNDIITSNHVCSAGTKLEEGTIYPSLSGTQWDNIPIGLIGSNNEICCNPIDFCTSSPPLRSGTTDDNNDIQCEIESTTDELVSGNVNCESDSDCLRKDGLFSSGIKCKKVLPTMPGTCIVTGEYKSAPHMIDRFKDGQDTIQQLISCCKKSTLPIETIRAESSVTEPTENIGPFTNMYEPFTNKNVDSIIEGMTNTDESVESECDIIKQGILTKLNLIESQVGFDCKLNATGDKYLIEANIVSTEQNPIPEDIKEQIRTGIPIEMLGIKITSTLGLNDERVDNEKTRSIVIVVLVILILLSLFGGIYMFKK